MYVTKKQFWILEMIKGADLVPAGTVEPGRYRPKDRMILTTEGGGCLTIGPDVVLDFSSDEILQVVASDRSLEISWNGIARIDFETALHPPVYKQAYADGARYWMRSPADKKAG